MATTGKVRSNSIGVYVSTTTGPFGTAQTGNTFGDNTHEDDDWEIIACATSGSFSGSLEIIDATTKDNDGQREVLPGGLQWSMSAEGMVQFDLAGTVNSNLTLFDLWSDKTQIRVAWTTGESGDYMYYGLAYITSFEESAGLNEVANFSVSIEGDGAITKALVSTTKSDFLDNDI